MLEYSRLKFNALKRLDYSDDWSTVVKSENKKHRYLDWLMGLLAIIMLVGLAAACIFKTSGYDGFHIDKSYKIKSTFHVSWGDNEIDTTLPAVIDNPDMDTIRISAVLYRDELPGCNSILFRSRQSRAKVYLDDTPIYDSGEAFNVPFSMGYGSLWKSLQLGNYNGKVLTIELQPGYDMQAVSGYLPTIYAGTQVSFVSMILEKVLWTLLLTMLLIGAGIYYIVNGLFAVHKSKAEQVLFLGLFAVDTGLWMLIECHVLELFISNMQAVIYLSYLTYGMMPVLLVRFMLSYEEFKEKIYLKGLCYAGVLLNIVQLLLAATGICSLFESQWMNRIYLGFTIIGLLLALFSVRKVEKEQRRKRLYSGILILVISTVLELLYFFFVSKANSGKILIIGICVFILKAGFNLIREGRDLRRNDLEKEILQTMAYTDGMTHLGNRFAYEQEKRRLEKSENTHVTIMIADMNGLKQANDNYGHSYGDQVICKTAELLEASFHDVAKCYRIGGDEFCVLAENVEPSGFKQCIDNLNEQCRQLSSDIKDYSIATGVAEGSAHDIDDIFHEADNLMYDCKKRMKGK